MAVAAADARLQRRPDSASAASIASIVVALEHERVAAARCRSSMCSVIEPRSVRTPRRRVAVAARAAAAAPRRRAATVNGRSSRSPTAIVSPSRTKRRPLGAAAALADRAPGAAAHPHRQAVALGERDRTADVVAVLVGDEDRVEIVGREPGARQPASRARAARSRQSTSRRVVVMPLVASTTVALPLLPLPRLQKRHRAGLGRVRAPGYCAGLRAAG